MHGGSLSQYMSLELCHYLLSPCSFCPWPDFGEQWPPLAPLCLRQSAAAPPEWAALSLSSLWHGCSWTTAGANIKRCMFNNQAMSTWMFLMCSHLLFFLWGLLKKIIHPPTSIPLNKLPSWYTISNDWDLSALLCVIDLKTLGFKPLWSERRLSTDPNLWWQSWGARSQPSGIFDRLIDSLKGPFSKSDFWSCKLLTKSIWRVQTD